MKRLAIAAAAAAALLLGACTSSPQNAAAAHHGSTAARATVTVPVSCSRRYAEWARADGKGVMHTLAAVTRDVSGRPSSRHGALARDLTRLRHPVAVASRHPIPACADPRGYWDVLLMHVTAAVAAAHSAAGVRAAMQDVPELHHNLLIEVARTAQ